MSRSVALVFAAAALLAGAAPLVEAQERAVQSDTHLGAQEVVSGGTKLWFRVAGSAREGAPPVVFLHGGPGQGSAHFDALVGPHLERSLRMVYLDQRGSGHSARPADGDYAIATLLDDIEALRRSLGVPRIALVGHSFGGLLALEYAARHPERVSGLVFVAGVYDMQLQCALRLATLAERRRAAFERVRGDTLDAQGRRRSDCDLELRAFASGSEREAYSRETMFPDTAVAARIDSVEKAHGIRNSGEMGRALFSQGLLGYRFGGYDRVTMPVLVIAGSHDGAARAEGLRVLAERLPRGKFMEFERSGHFVYLDETLRFAREIAQFLRTPPIRQAGEPRPE